MAVTSGTLTVTTTRGVVDGTSPNPYTLIIHNESASNNIRLGGADVTSANGLELHSHSSVTLQMFAGDSIYAVTTSGSHDISWLKLT